MKKKKITKKKKMNFLYKKIYLSQQKKEMKKIKNMN